MKALITCVYSCEALTLVQYLLYSRSNVSSFSLSYRIFRIFNVKRRLTELTWKWLVLHSLVYISKVMQRNKLIMRWARPVLSFLFPNPSGRFVSQRVWYFVEKCLPHVCRTLLYYLLASLCLSYTFANMVLFSWRDGFWRLTVQEMPNTSEVKNKPLKIAASPSIEQ